MDLSVFVAEVVPPGPDVDAFIGGLQVGLGSAVVLIALLAGVSLIRRILE